MATSLGDRGMVVVGYFSNGDEAHRAINALVDEGFMPGEIGAAFHVGSQGGSSGSMGGGSSVSSNSEETRQANVGTSLREELGTTHPAARAYDSGSTTGGAASDSSMVQYAALGGGAGTPFDGAGRPGPITGSSLANTGLPTELKSELPHDAPLPHEGRTSSAPASMPDASRLDTSMSDTSMSDASMADTSMQQQPYGKEGWGDKLKHVFGIGTHREQETPVAAVTDESQAFGTGEGHLVLDNPSSQRYSRPAFEQSFSSYGVQPEHARHLSQRIGNGGAIVTVHAAGRSADAERVLEAHGGQVRFSGTGEDSPVSEGQGQVEVFGTVHRDYSSYNL